MGNYKYSVDLIGTKFGKLTVIDNIPKGEQKNKKFIEYLCQCECGRTKRIRRNNLISGRSKSCGCTKAKITIAYNAVHSGEKLIGKRFGKLVVESEVPKSEWKNEKKREYFCKCDCGNTTRANRSALRFGNKRSCGCLLNEHQKNQFEDLTGKVFGELTAIKRVDSIYDKSGNPITRWLFRCSCGRELVIRIGNVKNGATKSCGHMGKSLAEYEMSKWLLKNNIRFDIQATFADLKNPETNRRLKYDFKIYRNDGSFFIVEHHGVQHFRNCEDGFGKLQRERTDKIKKDYCKAKGITIYETLYNEDYIARLQEIIDKELGQDGDVYEKEVMTG